MTQAPKTYQGKPCPHGHDGTRYTANYACVTCAKTWQATNYNRNSGAARKRAYRARKAASNA